MAARGERHASKLGNGGRGCFTLGVPQHPKKGPGHERRSPAVPSCRIDSRPRSKNGNCGHTPRLSDDIDAVPRTSSAGPNICVDNSTSSLPGRTNSEVTCDAGNCFTTRGWSSPAISTHACAKGFISDPPLAAKKLCTGDRLGRDAPVNGRIELAALGLAVPRRIGLAGFHVFDGGMRVCYGFNSYWGRVCLRCSQFWPVNKVIMRPHMKPCDGTISEPFNRHDLVQGNTLFSSDPIGHRGRLHTQSICKQQTVAAHACPRLKLRNRLYLKVHSVVIISHGVIVCQ